MSRKDYGSVLADLRRIALPDLLISYASVEAGS